MECEPKMGSDLSIARSSLGSRGKLFAVFCSRQLANIECTHHIRVYTTVRHSSHDLALGRLD
jgi:hypothetical protein